MTIQSEQVVGLTARGAWLQPLQAHKLSCSAACQLNLFHHWVNVTCGMLGSMPVIVLRWSSIHFSL